MRRILLPIAILALVGVAIWWMFLRGPDEPAPWLGYVEGESIQVAAPVSGTLARLDVTRGGKVAAGDALFALNAVSTEAQLRQLQAQRDQAQAQLEDLQSPRQRPAELGVSRAQQEAARAEVERTQREYERIATLAEKGFATRSQLDAAKAARDSARATLRQAQASEASGELAGRQDQIEAARAQVQQAEAAIAAQRRRGDEIAPAAPVAAQVQQTYFNPGEWVPANTPVVRLLPPDKVRIRFFVPESVVSTLQEGQAVRVSCDGCGDPFSATIRYIAPQAEFTPPIIYSEDAREKFVFLVEAQPQGDVARLHPGVPVEVRPQ
ncbi:HlyD family secretion protein [Stakelama tenebrarum]|uniref:HlyD family efflux transporter periplasmic adaptor subunit n=1 Tax=Stakelama tenebrarum TaxID=2711215 RepID=A0A6G6Y6A9_9SPHN|nr:HlyD family efflux transporter periplasmic adaptor subunit [Sphingosinithalassobacter tenebrarum]QIG80484.1 HlyD family efflux transporter periplasmic adaptor subunit [Sphingosinithalassobacter tenebrarum]